MNQSKNQSRIPGLDTFRFIAALLVVFGHCGYPPLDYWTARAGSMGTAFRGAYGNLFGPVPAVIVFFLISGFCIHYPYRAPNAFNLLPYLARRYLRIGIPLIAAVLLANPFHVNLSFLQSSVLWSLVAELIFYSLYPLLRVLQARIGWNKIIIGSYAISVAVVGIFYPWAVDYSPPGNGIDWLICFPYWLLGCRLAEENFKVEGPVSKLVLWRWRLLVWFGAWASNVLRFHSPVGYPWTMGLFALLLYFWLRIEIKAFCAGKKPVRLFEWAGQWSYSMYLMHLIALAVFGTIHLPAWGVIPTWFCMMAFILAFCYTFYLVVEKPSHAIARLSARFLGRSSRKAVTPAPNLSLPAQTISTQSPD